MRQLVLHVVRVSELGELTQLNDDADGLLSELLHDLGRHALKLLHVLVVPRARGKLLIRLVSLTDQTDEPIFTLGKILNEVQVVLELVDEGLGAPLKLGVRNQLLNDLGGMNLLAHRELLRAPVIMNLGH